MEPLVSLITCLCLFPYYLLQHFSACSCPSGGLKGLKKRRGFGCRKKRRGEVFLEEEICSNVCQQCISKIMFFDNFTYEYNVFRSHSHPTTFLQMLFLFYIIVTNILRQSLNVAQADFKYTMYLMTFNS